VFRRRRDAENERSGRAAAFHRSAKMGSQKLGPISEKNGPRYGTRFDRDTGPLFPGRGGPVEARAGGQYGSPASQGGARAEGEAQGAPVEMHRIEIVTAVGRARERPASQTAPLAAWRRVRSPNWHRRCDRNVIGSKMIRSSQAPPSVD